MRFKRSGGAGAAARVGVGMVVAEVATEGFCGSKGTRTMKVVVNNFMQLLAIIMMMITLAVSTAAVSMIFG
ncbi:MAG: hypothetical protein M3416_14025 [Acidobacteriota bacterium]|nr:hypothetical protein [Acidobacteriota bacterium]